MFGRCRSSKQAKADRTANLGQDVVNVPARSNVTVRILFDGFTGRSVHHCYILDHEDLGMMGVIDVRR